APASAIMGFCARMPCCNHASAAPLALAAGSGDCCTAAACYDAPSATLTASAPAVTFITAPLLAFAAPPVHAIAVAAHSFSDTSPPRRTGDRLAVLSILLI